MLFLLLGVGLHNCYWSLYAQTGAYGTVQFLVVVLGKLRILQDGALVLLYYVLAMLVLTLFLYSHHILLHHHTEVWYYEHKSHLVTSLHLIGKYRNTARYMVYYVIQKKHINTYSCETPGCQNWNKINIKIEIPSLNTNNSFEKCFIIIYTCFIS